MPTDATFTIQEAEASCDAHNLFAQSHLDAQPLIVPQICISHAALGENADAWPIAARGAASIRILTSIFRLLETCEKL